MTIFRMDSLIGKIVHLMITHQQFRSVVNEAEDVDGVGPLVSVHVACVHTCMVWPVNNATKIEF